MRRIIIWYLPQTVFFCFGAYTASSEPGMTPLAAVVVGLMWAAAYTGGANLVISLVARLKRNRRQSSGGTDVARAAGRSSSETSKLSERRLIGE